MTLKCFLECAGSYQTENDAWVAPSWPVLVNIDHVVAIERECPGVSKVTVAGTTRMLYTGGEPDWVVGRINGLIDEAREDLS